MDYLEILQGLGIYVSAIITLILLLTRTLFSLGAYALIGQWNSKQCLDGLFKQSIFYAFVFVSLGIMLIIQSLSPNSSTYNAILGTYYAMLVMIVSYTIGKLTILIKYALNQGGSLEDFVDEDDA